MTAKDIGLLQRRLDQLLSKASFASNADKFAALGAIQELVSFAMPPHAALSASRQGGWISVDARLPSHEQEVICTGFEGNDPAKKRWQEFATFHECGLFYDTVLGEQLYPPTHWQPTPAAPQQSQEAQGDRHGE